MPKYSGPDDIYRELVEESDENWLLGLLAFAVVEEQRIEWAKHRLETTGFSPTEVEVQGWYESQPASNLIKARAEAETALETYGQQAVESFDDAYRREIEDGIVVREIQKLGRWGPQLGVNVVGGILSSLIFAAILIYVAFIVLNDTSSNDIADKLKQKMELTDG